MSMSWFTEIVGDLVDYGVDFASGDSQFGDFGTQLFQLGIGQLAKDSGVFETKIPQVGYQGEIPKYQAVRERVPMQPTDEGGTPRRPGEAGRRYFSDTIFAQRPDTGIPTLEEAQAAARAQADLIGGIVPPDDGGGDTGGGDTGGGDTGNDNANTGNPVDPDADAGGIPPDNRATGSVLTGSENTNNTRSDDNPAVMEMAMGGGISSMNNGYYLGGTTDGMADEVPANIDGKQEARLSDGEFVIPADVVSHLGNGNSDAGAKQLHSMMDGVRTARTGNSEQGKQIDPNKFMPSMGMAQGGIASYNYGGPVQKFQEGSGGPVTPASVTPASVDDNTDANTNTGDSTGGTLDNIGGQGGDLYGKESSLSSWAGDYVTSMLGRGQALSETPYDAYEGPLSAGASDLQEQAFTSSGLLTAPEEMGTYTPTTFGAEQATTAMNPYLMESINPQLDEARRQSEIDRVANAGRLTKAGGFGGSRQAVMEAENTRNLQRNLADITGKEYARAYDVGRQQFNTEQDRAMKAQDASNRYGFDVIGSQQGLGSIDRSIESEGMKADYLQFMQERDYPLKQVQYMQSLLQDMPLTAQTNAYSLPSSGSDLAANMEGITGLLKLLGLGGSNTKEDSTSTDSNSSTSTVGS